MLYSGEGVDHGEGVNHGEGIGSPKREGGSFMTLLTQSVVAIHVSISALDRVQTGKG